MIKMACGGCAKAKRRMQALIEAEKAKKGGELTRAEQKAIRIKNRNARIARRNARAARMKKAE